MKLIENVKNDLENICAIETKENKSKVVDKSHDKIDVMSDVKIYVKNECIENPEDVIEISQVEEEETKVVEENLDKLDANNDANCNNHKEEVDSNNNSEIERKLKEEVVDKQRLDEDGNEEDVVKGMDALVSVPLLQANLAIMMLCVKTLQEQSIQLARLSDLSQPSLQIPSQHVALSSRSQCSCSDGDNVQDAVQGNHDHHKEDGDKHGQHGHGAVQVPAGMWSSKLFEGEVDPVIHWDDYEREP